MTEGFRAALAAREELEGLVPLDEYDDERQLPGAVARDAIFTGPLNLLEEMRRGAHHERHWAVVAPNSNAIPGAIVKALADLGVTALAPSGWALEQIENLGLTGRVVLHGIWPGPVADRQAAIQSYAKGYFRVAHFSTSAGERKGTLELIRAWSILRQEGGLPEHAELYCILDFPEAEMALLDRLTSAGLGLPTGVVLHPRVNMTAANRHRVLEQVHLVCQPSRGEAFGLVPLEALAAGVPVAATLCTGHSEYLPAAGCFEIKTGPRAPIDDGPGALAPSVDPHEIARMLHAAYTLWEIGQLRVLEAAEALQAKWAWPMVLAPFLNGLTEV